MRTAIVLALGLAVTGCVQVRDAGVARLSTSPILAGGTYDSGGGITVAADVLERDGRVTVCGVWAQSEQQSVLSKGVEPRVLGTGSVHLGDSAVVRGLGFMTEVAPAPSYGGAMASCVQTERAWTEADAAKPVTIRIPRQLVYRDADQDGVIEVYFEPTGPGAGATALKGTILGMIGQQESADDV